MLPAVESYYRSKYEIRNDIVDYVFHSIINFSNHEDVLKNFL